MKWKNKSKSRRKKVSTTKIPDNYYYHVPKEFDSCKTHPFNTEVALKEFPIGKKAVKKWEKTSKKLRQWMQKQFAFKLRVSKRLLANPLYFDNSKTDAVKSACSFLMASNNDDIEAVMAMGGPALIAEEVLNTDIKYLKANMKKDSRMGAGLQLFYETRSIADAILNAMACSLDSTRPIPPQSSDWYHLFSICALSKDLAATPDDDLKRISNANGQDAYGATIQTCLSCERKEGENKLGSMQRHDSFMRHLELRKRYDIGTYRSTSLIVTEIQWHRELRKQDPEGWEDIRKKEIEKFEAVLGEEVHHTHLDPALTRKLKKVGKDPSKLLKWEKIGYPTIEEFSACFENLLGWDQRVLINVIMDIRQCESCFEPGELIGRLVLPGRSLTRSAFMMISIFNEFLRVANESSNDDAVPLLNLKAISSQCSSTSKTLHDYCHGAMDKDGYWTSW